MALVVKVSEINGANTRARIILPMLVYQVSSGFDTRQVMSILLLQQNTTYLDTRQLTWEGKFETLINMYHEYGIRYWMRSNINN